jgi:hypothetical protein
MKGWEWQVLDLKIDVDVIHRSVGAVTREVGAIGAARLPSPFGGD